MPRIAIGLLAMIGLVACGGEGADVDGEPPTSTSHAPSTTVREEPGPPYVGELTFDWPTDCSVSVSEEVVRKGARAELAYDLVLTASGDNTELELDEMQVVTFRGERPPASMAKQLAVPFALPRLVFDGSGLAVEVRGIEELFEEMAALDPSLDLRSMPSALREQLGQALLDKYWGTWAGLWAGWATIDEAEETVEIELPLGGQVVPQTLTVRSVRTTADGDAVLSARSTLDGDGFRAAMQSLMDTLEGSASPEELASLDGERVTTMEVTTDPRTLRPRVASIEIATDVSIGNDNRREIEHREWRFDWPGSTC